MNKSPDEKTVLESNIIIAKLKDFVSKTMWMKILEEKKKHEEMGLDFNILDALLIAEHVEKESEEEFTPLVGINNLETLQTSNQRNEFADNIDWSYPFDV